MKRHPFVLLSIQLANSNISMPLFTTKIKHKYECVKG
jgi:hypothetical protein